jgi:hypothetical protein
MYSEPVAIAGRNMEAEQGDIGDLRMAHLATIRNKCRRHTLANVR